jgi:hypothetical protein
MVMRTGLLGHWNQQMVYLKWFSKVGFQHTSNFITKCPCSYILEVIVEEPHTNIWKSKVKLMTKASHFCRFQHLS